MSITNRKERRELTRWSKVLQTLVSNYIEAKNAMSLRKDDGSVVSADFVKDLRTYYSKQWQEYAKKHKASWKNSAQLNPDAFDKQVEEHFKTHRKLAWIEVLQDKYACWNPDMEVLQDLFRPGSCPDHDGAVKIIAANAYS